MTMRRRTLAWFASLVLAATCGLALAQEGEGPQAGGRRPRRGPEGGPGLGRAGGQRGPRGPMGIDIPAVRQEMKRHMEEMRGIMAELRPQGGGIREKIRELRENGATREEIRAALKPDPAKALAVAGRLADAFATHHATRSPQAPTTRRLRISRPRILRLRHAAGPCGPAASGARRASAKGGAAYVPMGQKAADGLDVRGPRSHGRLPPGAAAPPPSAAATACGGEAGPAGAGRRRPGAAGAGRRRAPGPAAAPRRGEAQAAAARARVARRPLGVAGKQACVGAWPLGRSAAPRGSPRAPQVAEDAARLETRARPLAVSRHLLSHDARPAPRLPRRRGAAHAVASSDPRRTPPAGACRREAGGASAPQLLDSSCRFCYQGG